MPPLEVYKPDFKTQACRPAPLGPESEEGRCLAAIEQEPARLFLTEGLEAKIWSMKRQRALLLLGLPILLAAIWLLALMMLWLKAKL